MGLEIAHDPQEPKNNPFLRAGGRCPRATSKSLHTLPQKTSRTINYLHGESGKCIVMYANGVPLGVLYKASSSLW